MRTGVSPRFECCVKIKITGLMNFRQMQVFRVVSLECLKSEEMTNKQECGNFRLVWPDHHHCQSGCVLWRDHNQLSSLVYLLINSGSDRWFINDLFIHVDCIFYALRLIYDLNCDLSQSCSCLLFSWWRVTVDLAVELLFGI